MSAVVIRDEAVQGDLYAKPGLDHLGDEIPVPRLDWLGKAAGNQVQHCLGGGIGGGEFAEGIRVWIVVGDVRGTGLRESHGGHGIDLEAVDFAGRYGEVLPERVGWLGGDGGLWFGGICGEQGGEPIQKAHVPRLIENYWRISLQVGRGWEKFLEKLSESGTTLGGRELYRMSAS